MKILRQLSYRLLLLPNQSVELLIRALSYIRYAYCQIVWAGPNELFYSTPQHLARLEWLSKNVVGKTIEVGCSTGYITENLNLAVGLDLDRRRLKRAKWFRSDYDFVCADGSRLPFADKQYDTVILSEVLEHVPFTLAQQIVCEACRVGQKVLITIPKLPKYLRNPEHLWIPTDEEKINELIGQRKCDIVRSPDEDYFWVKLFP